MKVIPPAVCLEQCCGEHVCVFVCADFSGRVLKGGGGRAPQKAIVLHHQLLVAKYCNVIIVMLYFVYLIYVHSVYRLHVYLIVY